MKNLKKLFVSLMVVTFCIFAVNVQASHAANKYLKYAGFAAGAIVVGTVGFVFAAPIAVAIGSTGILGAASTGTAISTLSGAAASSASLAALGGGAIGSSSFAMGMAGGTAVVSGGAAIVGGTASGLATDKLLDE